VKFRFISSAMDGVVDVADGSQLLPARSPRFAQPRGVYHPYDDPNPVSTRSPRWARRRLLPLMQEDLQPAVRKDHSASGRYDQAKENLRGRGTPLAPAFGSGGRSRAPLLFVQATVVSTGTSVRNRPRKPQLTALCLRPWLAGVDRQTASTYAVPES